MAEEMQPATEVSTNETADVHERFESWLNSDESQDEPAAEEGDVAPDEQAEAEPEAESEEDQPAEVEAENSEADETETLTIDGEEVTLPKEVAEKVTKIQKRLEADYTRKTQEAAEMRRAATQSIEETKQLAAFQQENIGYLAELHSAQNELQAYENVDWASLAETDIAAYSKHKEIRDGLREKAYQLNAELQNRQRFMGERTAQEQQQKLQSVIDTVKRAIPTYDEATDRKAVQAAETLGKKYGIQVDTNTLKQMLDPLVWIGLVELSKYQDLVAKRPETHKQVQGAKPPVKPTGKPTSSEQSRAQKIQKLLSQGRIREAAQL